MSTARFCFLGPIRLQVGSQSVELTIAKAQALLAYLALTGIAHSRERIMALLWAESHPEAARKNLRNTLWQIRRHLGTDLLVANGEMLMLTAAVDTDVAEFEQAVTAALESAAPSAAQLNAVLALRDGPLLADLALTDAPDFELWLDGERRRLDALYVRTLSQLVACHRRTAQWAGVLEAGRRILACDAADEAAHAALMEAHARLGQRSAALQQFDLLQTTLARELGTTPLPATLALYRRILAGDLDAGTGITSGMPVRPGAPSAGRGALQQPEPVKPFIGRRAEQDLLTAALQKAAAGHLQIVFITGELGMGKSYLWRRWSSGLPAGTVVLEARCLDTTRTLPFAPLAGLFGMPQALNRVAGADSPVPPIWLSELARLLPQIRVLRPDLPDALPLPPEEEHRRIFEAFVQTLRLLHAAPLVLFIDDLHWADQATLDWLVYLVDRMRDAPLLVVGAYRPDEAPAALTASSADWSRSGLMARLSLAPLTVAESTELIAALKGDTGTVDRLYARSRGNPYFLTELSRAHPDGLPDALADLIRARLHRLPESAQRLLQLAAILEPNISFDTLQSILQQPEEATLDALDLLLARSILVEHGEIYEFAHPLLVDLVRHELSGPRRRRLHLQVAEHLRALVAKETDAPVGRLSRHYAEAGQADQAAHFADIAAAQAVQVGAMAEAVNFYREACRLEPTPTRRLELGHALMHVPGKSSEAQQAMQEALAEFEAAGDQQGIVQAGLRLAFSYLAVEKGEEVLFWAERIREAAQGESSVDLEATVQYLMAAGKSYMPHTLDEADRHFHAATELAARHELVSDIALQSWFGWGNVCSQRGDFEDAHAKFVESMALAEASNNIYFVALCYNNQAYALLLAGRSDDAYRVIETGLGFIEQHELMRPRQYLYSTRGEVGLALEDPEGAASWFRAALEEARIYDNLTHAANIQANLGCVAMARGDYEAAEEELLAAYAAVPSTSAPHLQIQIELWLAELYIAWKKPDARRLLDSAQEKLRDSQRRALQEQADGIAALLASAPSTARD